MPGLPTPAMPPPHDDISAAAAGAPPEAVAVLRCQYQEWYPRFAAHAFRSQLVPLPDDFLAFLEEDGIFVPDGSTAVPQRGPVHDYADADEYHEWACDNKYATSSSASDDNDDDGADTADGDGSSSSSSRSGAESAADWPRRFPGLLARIEAAVEELGGSVAPKLNWSCPKDATWINPGGTLACRTAEEVTLLLKSSDRVAHDLSLLRQLAATRVPSAEAPAAAATSSAADGTRPESSGERAAVDAQGAPPALPTAPAADAASLRAVLSLRKWHALRPEREFRCFVGGGGGHLLAVCQRDASQHFPQLREEVGPMVEAIKAFHARHVACSFGLQRYTYDVYVATNGVVKIVDFNPAGGTTSALLFTWEELEEAEAEQGAAHDANAAPPPPSPPMGGVVGGDGAAAPPHQDGAHQHSGRLWRPSQQVLVRIVDDASLVQPGEKAACGMPFDMLMLQDRGAVQDMIDFMHRQPS